MRTPLIIAASVVALGIAACGSTSSVTNIFSNVPAPDTSSTTVPATAAPLITGYGDTTDNPDTTFACAYEASLNGLVIDYMTVAGSDTSALCSMSVAPWTPITSIAGGTYMTTAACFISDASATARIYTAFPDGDASSTQTICAGFLHQ